MLEANDYLADFGEYLERAKEERFGPGPRARPLPPEVEEAERDPEKRFGRYVRLKMVGQGGFGEVWKAYDLSLRQYRAIKILQSADEKTVRRLRREAEVLARLRHPGIAQVYGFEEAHGRYFIAMEFVDGPTLAEIQRELGLRKAVELVRDAAKAVHAAHRNKVLHRDLKPGNLMLRSEEGGVCVVDFGIAKPIEGTQSLTTEGSVLGTPAYMSPEQARAESLDPRTDVYSLGATLYHMVTGRPPFPRPRSSLTLRARHIRRLPPRGISVPEILEQVIDRYPPVSPRVLKPTLPPDLQSVLMKALEKTPEGRYATAESLAEDLERFLRGEPVEAKPPAVIRRVWTSLRRHPVVSISSIGAVASALLCGVAIHLGLLSTEVRARNFTLEALRAYESNDFEDARTKLEGALRLDPQQPEAHYLLAMLALKDYATQNPLPELWKVSPSLPNPTTSVRLSGYLAFERAAPGEVMGAGTGEQVRVHLEAYQRSAGRVSKGLLLSGHPADAAEGLLDLFSGAYETAATRLLGVCEGGNGRVEEWVIQSCARALYLSKRFDEAERLVRSRLLGPGTPSVENALLFGRILHAGALVALQRGDDPTSRVSEAVEKLSALDRYLGRPDPAVRSLLVDMKVTVGDYLASRGADPMPAYDEAVEYCRSANTLDGYLALGDAFLARAAYCRLRGLIPRDGRSDFDEALAAYDRAIDANERSARAWGRRGIAYRELGDLERSRGLPTYRERLARAVADLECALRLLPGDPELRIARARVRGVLERSDTHEKRIKMASFEKEADELAGVTADSPWYSKGLVDLADCFVEWAYYAMNRGEDPRPLLERASTALDLPLGEAHAALDAQLLASQVHYVLATYEGDRGEDPSPAYDQAIRFVTAALEAGRGNSQVLVTRGFILQNISVGMRSSQYRDMALRDFDDAIRVNSQDAEAWMGRGICRVQAVLYGGGQRDLGRDLQGPFGDLDRATQLRPDDPRPYGALARLWDRIGEILQENAQDPSNAYAEAIRLYSQALERNREDPDLFADRSVSKAIWAAWLKNHSGDPSELFPGALEDAARAIELNPESWQAYRARGKASLWTADWYSRREESEYGKLLVQALGDYERALEINPGQPALYWEKAQILSMLDRHLEAVGADAEAIRLNPTMWMAFRDRGANYQFLAWEQEDAGEDPTAYYQQAAEDLRQAVSMNASDLDSWRFLADTLQYYARHLGQHDAEQTSALGHEAFQAYSSAIGLSPSAAWAWANRGKLRAFFRDGEGALGDLKEAIRLDPSLCTELADELRLAEELLRSDR